MKLPIKKAIFFIFMSTLLFCGCSKNQSTAQNSPISATDFKLNTVITINIYDSDNEDLLTECMNLCDKYESIFSRTDPDSELYQLNHRQLQPVDGTTDTYQLSDELAELLAKGISYSQKSEGAFNIALAPLTSIWDFTSENPQIPDEAAIQEALSKCDFNDVILDGCQITLPSADTAFDLGGIAKGYIADKLKEYLVSQNVQSATINLGGNVLCIGMKPDETPFKIGIQKPFADRNETIAVMEIDGKSVVSSGIYERYFEQDDTLYHHILDSTTGYPYDNDLVSVTIISDKSVDGDALSTTCFALGLEKGKAYAEALEDVQAVFVTQDYEVIYTDGFEDAITLIDII